MDAGLKELIRDLALLMGEHGLTRLEAGGIVLERDAHRPTQSVMLDTEDVFTPEEEPPGIRAERLRAEQERLLFHSTG